jgi:hypothetical protein
MSFYAWFFRLNPLQVAVPLLLCALLFLCAGRTAEADVSSLTFGNESILSIPAVPTAFALGSNRDKEALATRNVQEPPSAGQVFQGSFLGALIFGYPYEGLGTVDIVALGLLLLFVARAVTARRRDQQSSDRFSVDRPDFRRNQDFSEEREEKQRTRVEDLRPADPGNKDAASGNSRDNAWSRRLGGGGKISPPAQVRRPTTVQENAAAMWGRFSSQGQQQNEAQAESVATGVEIPAGFDVHEFLEGARTLYVRLQQAWASRKVDDLAPFVSAQMLGLLQKQAAASPDPVPVEILLVNATLDKVAREGQTEKAEVAFSVVMRTGQEEEPAEVNETWLFARGGDFGGMWQLTGIRQS